MTDPQQPAPDFDPWAPATAPSTRRSRRSVRPTAPQVFDTPEALPTPETRTAEPREQLRFQEPTPSQRTAHRPPSFGTGAPEGLGHMLDGDRRRLSQVNASGAGAITRVLGALFTSRRDPERMARAAAGAQAPVGTGRRIAVVSTSGGAGKSTAAALLGRVYSAVRSDTVSVLDLEPGAGSLGLRLGIGQAAPIDVLAAATSSGTMPGADELASMLGHAAPNLFATGPRTTGGHGRVLDAHGLREGSAALSRYFPITLLDCPTSLDDPLTAAVLNDCHGALFVLPATLPGIENALTELAGWFANRALSALPLTLLVMEQDRASALSATALADRLGALGFSAHAIGYDRHLAAGAQISLTRLNARHRLAATELAAALLADANSVR